MLFNPGDIQFGDGHDRGGDTAEPEAGREEQQMEASGVSSERAVQGFQGGRALHKAVFGFQRLVGESHHPLPPPRLRGVPHPQPSLLFPGGDRGDRDCRGGVRFASGGEGKEEGDTGSEV